MQYNTLVLVNDKKGVPTCAFGTLLNKEELPNEITSAAWFGGTVDNPGDWHCKTTVFLKHDTKCALTPMVVGLSAAIATVAQHNLFDKMFHSSELPLSDNDQELISCFIVHHFVITNENVAEKNEGLEKLPEIQTLLEQMGLSLGNSPLININPSEKTKQVHFSVGGKTQVCSGNGSCTTFKDFLNNPRVQELLPKVAQYSTEINKIIAELNTIHDATKHPKG